MLAGMNATILSRLCQAPVPFDRRVGAETAFAFSDLEPAAVALLAGAAGCSPYLNTLLHREANWLRQALCLAPEAVLQGELGALTASPLDIPGEVLAVRLREAKRRVALLVALCDLGGVWPLETVTGALTALADGAVDVSIRSLVWREIARGRLPDAVPDDVPTAAGMVVLAMGKMGAGELNYSSDIDLICLFDEQRYAGAEQEARAAFIRVARGMTSLLSDTTPGGYVFRTDLRLRPDASVTPVCLSMAAAESYYEAVGRTWERAAYIKARPCAGDVSAGARFLGTLIPFVWRKHLDFAAIQDAHDMRLRIRRHRGLNVALQVDGHDLKLGLGGIREIEFFAQTRQLIAGGRDPDLRDPTTEGALRALAAKGWVEPAAAEDLIGHYRAHRMLEHRLQMVNDAQTHLLPATAEGVARIAAFMGAAEPAFRAGLLARLRQVDRLTEGFFSPAGPETAPELSELGQAIVAGWRKYPALRSDRAQEIFRRLGPQLLRELQRSSHPDETLAALDGFMSGLPAGVQIFSLFEANPALVALIVDIAGTAPVLARYLARNAVVLDAVIGGSFFAPWPDLSVLKADLAARLGRQGGDYEAVLGAIRVWMKEGHFRIGVHHLRGLIGAEEAGRHYAALADAVLDGLWPRVVAAFAAKHGPPPGQGAVVMAMGGLGAGRLNAASDLDLIVIYDAQGEAASQGHRPLSARTYFARLTQALVTALTAPMAEGTLYPVDMRLRPSGRQGPVATSLASFVDYQRTEAWTWEHLALTRARVVAGDPGLAGRVETFRCTLLAEKAAGPAVRRDVAEMRARIETARPVAGVWEAKNGPGRLLDIDLFAQMVALLQGSPARQPEPQLASGAGAILSQSEETTLCEAGTLFWCLHCAARLLSDHALDVAALGEGGRAFILRETGAVDAEALSARIEDLARRARAVIGMHLAEGTEHGEKSSGA